MNCSGENINFIYDCGPHSFDLFEFMEMSQAVGPDGWAQMVISKTSSPLIGIPIIINIINTILLTSVWERVIWNVVWRRRLCSPYLHPIREISGFWQDQLEIPGRDSQIQYGGCFSEEISRATFALRDLELNWIY